MNSLLSILGFILATLAFGGIIISVVFMIISMIKKNKQAKKWFLIFVGCFVLFLIGARLGAENDVNFKRDTTTMPQTELITDANKQELTLKKKIESKLKTSNLPDYTNRLLEINDLDDTIEILFIANDNVTASLFETGVLKDSWNVIQVVFDDSSCKHYDLVALRFYFPTIDSYGNQELSRIGRLLLEKKQYELINKENFKYDDLPKIAVNYGLRTE